MEDNQESNLLRPHSFDGIQEYDNQLPRWWVMKFWLTIGFAVAYIYWFHLADEGRGLMVEYEIETKKMAMTRAKEPTSVPLTEDELRAYIKDPEILKSGAAIFHEKCVSCHADDGGGIVGPNLTDRYWLHGNQMLDIVRTVTDGVPEKGMIPWKSLLNRDQIHWVSAYIKSLEGTIAKNPKKPEGTLATSP